MKTIKYISLFILYAFFTVNADAQRYKDRGADSQQPEEAEAPKDSTQFQKLRKKLLFGGNLAGSLGTGFYYLDISPMVGYKVTDKLIAGVGATYITAKYTLYYSNGNKAQSDVISIYGGRLYSQYTIYKGLFAHGEYELLNVPFFNYTPTKGNFEDRMWLKNPFVGGGYRSSLGSNSFFNISVLYNINYAKNFKYSPYSSPFVIRFGFMF